MAQNKKVNHDEVIRLYRDEKCTIRQIIDRLGISRQIIYTILKRNNIELSNPKYISHVIYDRDKIIRLRENKLSYPDIAKELGCSIGTVYHVLNKNNMIGKFKLGAKDGEIIKLYNSGMTQQAISSAIGVSQSYVSKILKKDKQGDANMNNNQLIAKRYNDGASIKELANEFKLGQQRIRQILISEKIIVTRKHTTVITKEIRDIVHKLYFKAITPCNSSDIEFPKDKILSQKEIASILNISRGTVDIIINKAKFISRATRQMNLEDDILIAFDKFKSISEVTRTTGILEEIVEFVLLMHGVRKYLLSPDSAKVLIYKLNELGFAKSLIADIVGPTTNATCQVLIKTKHEGQNKMKRIGKIIHKYIDIVYILHREYRVDRETIAQIIPINKNTLATIYPKLKLYENIYNHRDQEKIEDYIIQYSGGTDCFHMFICYKEGKRVSIRDENENKIIREKLELLGRFKSEEIDHIIGNTIG